MCFLEKELLSDGYPAYTTSAGWIGYTDEQIVDLCQKYMAKGWTRYSKIADYISLIIFTAQSPKV